jgi:hypothetical protein
MLGSISSSRCQTTCASSQRPRARELSFSRTSCWCWRPYAAGNQTSGGARRDRTDDLLLAKQALSQLSYGPNRKGPPSLKLRRATFTVRRLVGLGRFELPTSRLSSARSNQLSYKPVTGVSDQKSETRKFASYLITEYRLLTPGFGSFAKKEKRRRRRPANGQNDPETELP